MILSWIDLFCRNHLTWQINFRYHYLHWTYLAYLIRLLPFAHYSPFSIYSTFQINSFAYVIFDRWTLFIRRCYRNVSVHPQKYICNLLFSSLHPNFIHFTHQKHHNPIVRIASIINTESCRRKIFYRHWNRFGWMS